MLPHEPDSDGRATKSASAANRDDPPAQWPRRGARLNHGDLSPEVIARLEWLDDLMFAAIDGDPVAFERAADAWRKTLDELGNDALEETRLQYLRRAQSVWHELRQQPNHPPHKVFAAIEIISLLADKAW
jgi:hypothetical protein